MIVRDQLLDDATKISGLDEFGDVPFLEALDVLVDSFNCDARVEGGVRDRAAEMLAGVLVKRLRLVDDRRQHPEIADEVITAPIFIVGQPRSGSTHLHALLACVGGLRAPRFWELSAPSPPPERETDDSDPRIPIQVEGRIVPEISAAPEPLVLGDVALGQQVSKKVIVRGKKPFKIVSVDCPEDSSFQFKTDDKSSDRHVVEIVFDPKGNPGKVKQTIHITTDLGNSFGASVTAYATVTAPAATTANEPGAGTATTAAKQVAGQ